MKNSKRYTSVFTFATLQFDGHFLQYLKENTQHLVALYILSRKDNRKDFYEIYDNGRLVFSHELLIFRKNVVLAWCTYYIQYLRILLRHTSHREHTYVISFFPFFFFFGSLLCRIRHIEFIYWIGDYWPMGSLGIRIYRFFMHYYHARMPNTLYLSDRINAVMNDGHIVSSLTHKTAMWGIDRPQRRKTISSGIIKICFIGVLAPWQGIEILFGAVSKDKNLHLTLIGTGNANLVAEYEMLTRKYNISDRVCFPDRFYYGNDLKKIVQECHIGVALYNTDAETVTYYADPGKIKQYIEFGLPVVMTDASEIVSYVKNAGAGEIVDRSVDSVLHSFKKIATQYGKYQKGIRTFSDHFYFRSYYRDVFSFMA